eukprot:6186447-Pleurochrysis_carterae.AAC.4
MAFCIMHSVRSTSKSRARRNCRSIDTAAVVGARPRRQSSTPQRHAEDLLAWSASDNRECRATTAAASSSASRACPSVALALPMPTRARHNAARNTVTMLRTSMGCIVQHLLQHARASSHASCMRCYTFIDILTFVKINKDTDLAYM